MPTPSLPWDAAGAPPEHALAWSRNGRSQVAAFAEAVSQATGQDLRPPQALQAWSAREWRSFWRLWAQWCQLPGPWGPVCVGNEVEHARFFPAMRLNYADRLLDLAVAPAQSTALVACHPDGRRESWSRGALRQEVARWADAWVRQGLQPGDRVVAVMRHDAHAAIAALAVAAAGGILSTTAPEMGLPALVERFGPLRPRWLVAHMAPQPHDTGQPLGDKVAALANALPTLQAVLALDGTPPGAPTHPSGPGSWQAWTVDDLAAQGNPERFTWPQFDFNHPLFILFSSGTTGRPKCIVHGAGGSLIEHLKEHRLHCDLRPGERLYFHTTCSWMMWQWQLSALANGVQLVTWDGPVHAAETLWELVARERVQVFGTSPAYLRLSQAAGLLPGREYDLQPLRALLSTGAILHEAQFDWVAQSVGPVPVQSISGGTDILGCFVLGHPDLPVRRGDAQCRSLGMDVQAWQDGGPAQGVGQLVCTNPFPSRPLGFWDDADGSRFHAAYFAENPGVWTHGDLIELRPEGGARLHGRCDGVLNVRGIKLAPAEITAALQDVPALRELMVVEQSGEPAQVLALLVLARPVADRAALIADLRLRLSERLSPAHVPDRFVVVPALPVTHSGKLSEAAARAAINGQPVGNLQALHNPQVLESIVQAVAQRPLPALAQTVSAEGGQAQAAQCMSQLQALWAEVIGLPEVGPDDHFLDIGGTSLHAAVIVTRIKRMTQCTLPLASLLQAPTPRRLAMLMADLEEGTRAGRGDAAAMRCVDVRSGEGPPLVLVHGLSGTVMELWPVVQALKNPRPVVGLQAQGLDGGPLPAPQVEAIAADYVAALLKAWPHGPYALCGYSFGGLLALEMARYLERAGASVDLLCLVDPYLQQGLPQWQATALRSAAALRRWLAMDGAARRAYLSARWPGIRAGGAVSSSPLHPAAAAVDVAEIPQGLGPYQRAVYRRLLDCLGRYRPSPYVGSCRALFVRAQERLPGYFDPMLIWRRILRGPWDTVTLPGSHLQLVRGQAGSLARLLDQALSGMPTLAGPTNRDAMRQFRADAAPPGVTSPR